MADEKSINGTGCLGGLCPVPCTKIMQSQICREILGEILGTFVLVFVGTASIAQARLSKGQLGNVTTVTVAWGLAVMMGTYVSGGGHLNPAVTVALATARMFPWKYVAPYMLAQYFGSFVGALATFFVYFDALEDDRSVPGTAGIFATYPKDHLSVTNAFYDQVLGTALLLLCVMAITDKRSSMNVPRGLAPLVIGLVVIMIGMSLCLNCGFPLNPARDLGPRLVSFFAGWGSEVFEYGSYYFWIPIVAPHLGAIIGAWVYIILLRNKSPQSE